jgi:hypothetical protein
VNLTFNLQLSHSFLLPSLTCAWWDLFDDGLSPGGRLITAAIAGHDRGDDDDAKVLLPAAAVMQK